MSLGMQALLKKPATTGGNWLFIGLILLAVLIIKGIGIRITSTTLKETLSWYYAIDVAYVAGMASVVCLLNRYSILELSKKLDWSVPPYRKLLFRTLLNIAATALFILVCTAIYFSLQQLSFSETIFLETDFPVALLLTLLINVTYIVILIWQQYRFTLIKAQIAEVSQMPLDKAGISATLILSTVLGKRQFILAGKRIFTSSVSLLLSLTFLGP